MARKTRKQIEESSETITKIACDQCHKRHDKRGVRGKRGVYTLMLDVQPEYKGTYSYSNWNSLAWDRKTRARNNTHRLNAESVVDFCVEPCFDRVFINPDQHDMDAIDRELHHSIEVEETQYDVVEQETDEYLCDKCGTTLGESYEHEVSLNPRLKVYENSHTIIGHNRNQSEIATYSPDQVISAPRRNSIEPLRDAVFHTCTGCTKELFHLGTKESAKGILTPLKKLFTVPKI